MVVSEEAVEVGIEPVLGLTWPIKRSFILYVARMTEGQILGGRGLRMLDPSTFLFAPDQPSETGLLAFGGELRLSAHAGALYVRIAQPRVDLSGDRARLIIDAPEGGSTPLCLVTFDASPIDAAEGLKSWSGTDVRLTVEAVPLFGGYYGEGESFDDLSITIRPSRSS